MQKAIRTGQMVSWSVIFYTVAFIKFLIILPAPMLLEKNSPIRYVALGYSISEISRIVIL